MSNIAESSNMINASEMSTTIHTKLIGQQNHYATTSTIRIRASIPSTETIKGFTRMLLISYSPIDFSKSGNDLGLDYQHSRLAWAYIILSHWRATSSSLSI